ncbi:MAG: TatD family hydrolase [Parvibaculaceae bacterium]
MPAPIVDSHCHLDYPGLAERLPEVIAAARAADVYLMVSISTRMSSFPQVLAMAEKHPEIYCSVGVHPHNAAEEPDVTVEDFLKATEHPKVVAIGEAGLDYHYDHAPRDVQAKSFRTQIAAARTAGLPLIVHSREAEDDTARILEEEMGQGAFTPLLHCFSSKPVLAVRGLAIGAYVSFSGILTFRNAEDIRAAARLAPQDRVLVETDAPYLAPVPHRGKANEPAFTVHTLERLAEVKGVSRDAMARATSDNFFRLFSKVPRPEAFRAAA